MAGVAPRDFKTVEEMRDVIAAGDITVLKAFVFQVRVDGSPVTSGDVRAVADRITYDVRVVDTQIITDETPLNDLKPYNRAYTLGRVRACKVGDYAELVLYGPLLPSPNSVRLYLRGTEKPDPHDCEGNPLEPE